MMYHVGVDVHDYHVHTHGRKEVALYDEDWVTATEYAMNMVREQHPNADIELAYVKEYNARYMLPMSTKVLYTSEFSC
jgi:hypothetical protein|tara:strand:+ start:109 stop:342 length:234 start_codon:yes stop_codon:yes gene_type:complete